MAWFGIVIDVGFAQLLVVLRRGADRAVLAGDCQTVVDQFVQRVAVDGHRQGDAHIARLEELAQLVVLRGLVKLHGHVVGADPGYNLVVALGFVGLVQGVGGRVHVAPLEVNFTVGDPQVEDVHVLEQAVVDLVEVGQLVAVLIHPKEVGVALHHKQVLAQRFGGQPAVHCRQVGVSAPLGAIVEEVVAPAVDAGGLDYCIQSGFVCGQVAMELFQVDSWGQEIASGLGASNIQDQQRVGMLVDDGEGVIVDDLQIGNIFFRSRDPDRCCWVGVRVLLSSQLS